MRRIHWRATARHGDLMVRREEQAWHSSMVVDARQPRAGAHRRRAWRRPSSGRSLRRPASRCTTCVAAGTSPSSRRTVACWSRRRGTSSADVDGILQAFAEVRLSGEAMAPTLGAMIEGATSVVAVLGRVSDDTARALIRPMAGFTACLVLEPGPIDYPPGARLAGGRLDATHLRRRGLVARPARAARCCRDERLAAGARPRAAGRHERRRSGDHSRPAVPDPAVRLDVVAATGHRHGPGRSPSSGRAVAPSPCPFRWCRSPSSSGSSAR